MTSRFSPSKLDQAFLLRITTPSYYVRGLDYADQGRATLLTVDAQSVSATVSGSEDYAVELTWRNGTLHGQCDCPIGQQEEFCKHQVAVALTWARVAAEGPAPARRKRGAVAAPEAASPEQVLRQWLSTQSQQALQALLLELANNDSQLHKRLLSQAQLATAPLQDWRKAITTLLGRKRYMDWRDTVAYSQQLAGLTSLLEQARQRDPLAALDLHEYAFKRLLTIYEESDDSRGDLGERLSEVAHAHLDAARAAAADNLGSRLFELRMLDDWGLLRPLSDYAALLSAADIARLEHAVLKVLQTDGIGRTRQVLAASLLEDTARCGGNVDAMLDFFGRNSRSGLECLEMARRCTEHGRERRALDWLERGAKIAPDDTRLLSALAQAYLRDGFTEDALELRWKIYLLSLSEDAYLALREVASVPGQWDTWRERALQALDAKSVPRYVDPHETRIRLLLAEGQAQRAVDLAADQTRTLPLNTSMRLLPAAETCDPAAALRICHTVIEAHIARTQRQGYAAAISLLPTLQRLYRHQHGKRGQAAFDTELGRLRERYRIKRNFIALLDKQFPAG
ncbi:SWIM zinc finger family protein [Xanthomonas cucurbitae]|uniref:SWIM-type domain-containing protein n=1 Tax=Xanthomonas cucurbitae TaxID=56453 RepID=A0A2S7DQ46_9XANT|nr:hypothetical protein [Xanthomonas cucurbitae]PPU75953.1 hypothetical protein XcuCFBP2542_12370 [Xanthomonas cucurbitae]WDM67259.1 hypothetical protein K6981_17570 [Xanthomonas cucurbitae]WDM71137.1 hypothetical protein K6978_17535 [Xanthomonas cucurbitae]WDM79590.1 hypothetical protein K6980_02240 [Xanthomonas cucurbitae]WDM83280.1 hypothetical protein K6979_02250 [Xanthomonas cucurbitae]